MDRRTRIGIIGDEETLTGFLMAGIENVQDEPNLIQVSLTTSEEDLKKSFRMLTSRRDLAIILVCDFIAERLKEDIDAYTDTVPAILVIASKTNMSN